MAAIKFHKVTAMPGSPEANAVYFVVNGTFCETYVTDSAGNTKGAGNTAMINAAIAPPISAALADYNMVEIVADIPARNAFVAGKQRNLMLLVQDATGDATVASGAALYAWSEAGGTFAKIAEYEAMDVALTWANIGGRPASSPASIDDAVGKRHTHANQAALDKVGEDGGGNITYGGQPVGASWQTNNW